MRNLLTKLGVSLLSTLGICLVTGASGQSLTWLGRIPYTFTSYAAAVSADGTTVVGWCFRPGWKRAFRWNNGVMEDIGTIRFPDSYAHDVSADGTVVVGEAEYVSDMFHAFRWTLSERRMRDLGDLGGGESVAYGVSADGSVVVGYAWDAALQTRAFRWTESGGMEDIGTLGGCCATAYDISADGSVIVGSATTLNGDVHAFYKQGNQAMIDLGVIPPYFRSEAYAVSPDGVAVTGELMGFDNARWAYLWTATRGMRLLPALDGVTHCIGYGISQGGDIVVGTATVAGTPAQGWAVRWIGNARMENLNQVYASLLTDGSTLVGATDVSPDGRYIVGSGQHNGHEEAFLLDTWRTGDTNGDGCIDDNDLLAVLFAFGTPGTPYARHEDINKDGIVDDADLLIVLFNFGQGC